MRVGNKLQYFVMLSLITVCLFPKCCYSQSTESPLEEDTRVRKQLIARGAEIVWKEPGVARWVCLYGKEFGNDDVELLKSFPSMNWLWLQSPNFDDDAMQDVCRLTQLEVLFLWGTAVSDQGFSRIAQLDKLTDLLICGGNSRSLITCDLTPNDRLKLRKSPITKATCLLLQEMKSLRRLTLDGTDIDDDGLKIIGMMSHLTNLSLYDTLITDKGLSYLQHLDKLEQLYIGGRSKINGNGLAFLAQLPRLTTLNLSETRVTDAAAKSLTSFPRLSTVCLDNTLVTPEAIEELKAAMPLAIFTDSILNENGNAIDRLTLSPRLDLSPHYRHAFQLLGTIGAGLTIKNYRVSTVDIRRMRGPELGVTCCSRLESLEALLADGTRLDDEALRPLLALKRLERLTLRRTKISDGAMGVIGKIPQLQSLDVHDNAITDRGIADLAQATDLRDLNLSETPLTDDALPLLGKLKKLKRLNLNLTKVTAEGLAEFKAQHPDVEVICDSVAALE